MSVADTVAKLRELADSLERYDSIPDAEDRASWLRCVAVELHVEARKINPGPAGVVEYAATGWPGWLPYAGDRLRRALSR